jgi:hypothetical protein
MFGFIYATLLLNPLSAKHKIICMKKIIPVLIIIVIFFIACKKSTVDNNGETCTVATVKYAGDPAADGLGWILVTDTVNYKYLPPEEIPAAYKVNGLLVDVCYVKTDKDFVCFCPPPQQKIVSITKISKH